MLAAAAAPTWAKTSTTDGRSTRGIGWVAPRRAWSATPCTPPFAIEGWGGWDINPDMVVGTEAGTVVSLWVYGGTGRAYIAFDTDAAGSKSAVVSFNTNDIRFQNNPGFGYEELTTTPYDPPEGVWLQAEMTLDGADSATLRLKDEGGSVLATVSQDYTAYGGIGGGFIAIRSFNNVIMDDLSISYP
jgi:hypothetical protein